MEGSTLRRDFLLGLIFFGTIVLLIYYTINLTGFSFEPKPLMTIQFPNAAGLKQGDTVMVSGRPTGTVLAVDFDDSKPEDRRITVRAELEQPITLHQGYTILITEFTLLGGRVIEIEPGAYGAPRIPADAELLGAVGPSALTALGELVTENRDDIREFLENMRTVSDDLATGRGVIGALIHDEEMRTELDGIIVDARQIVADVRDGKGTLGMLIEDAEVRDDIVNLLRNGASAAEDLRQIAEDLAAGRGTFGALLTDEALRSDASNLIGNLTEVSASLKRMIDQADQGRGLLGKVIADEAMAADVTEFVHDLAVVIKRLEEGEGTLGRIMADEELYRELTEGVGLLNASLEDAREAQPIASFSSLLFGAF